VLAAGQSWVLIKSLNISNVFTQCYIHFCDFYGTPCRLSCCVRCRMRGSLHGFCRSSLSQLHTYSTEFSRRGYSPSCIPLPATLLRPRWCGRGTASPRRTIAAALSPRLCSLQHRRIQRPTSVHRYRISCSCCAPVDHPRCHVTCWIFFLFTARCYA